MTFEETKPWEQGFAAVYAQEIAPGLAELERRRLAVLARRNRRLLLLAAAAIGGAVVALVLVEDAIERLVWLGLVAILTGIGGLGLAASKADGFAQEVKAAIVPSIAAHLGIVYDPAAGAGPDPARFVEVGLLSRFDRAVTSDGLSGTHRGVAFASCGATLAVRERRRTGASDRTTFRGMLVCVSTHGRAPGTILIGPDLGPLSAVVGAFQSFFGGLQTVRTGHAAFDARFDVRAQEPKAAAAYLSGPFLDALVALAEEEGLRARGLRAAFVGERFYCAIPRREPVIPVGPLTESLSRVEPRVHRMLAAASFPIRLIDGFLGQEGINERGRELGRELDDGGEAGAA